MVCRRTFAAAFLVLAASVCALGRAQRPTEEHPHYVRALLASPGSVAVIYSGGELVWRSWSWGISALNQRDERAPMPGRQQCHLGLKSKVYKN